MYDGATLSLVLSVSTALTNVVTHTEATVELDAADWFDIEGESKKKKVLLVLLRLSC